MLKSDGARQEVRDSGQKSHYVLITCIDDDRVFGIQNRLRLPPPLSFDSDRASAFLPFSPYIPHLRRRFARELI